ncbi:hypothetical protein F4819DRAFT_139030 [Hypoxylon fuscum]|nr:hypothetical protein F4819DRAFT_139030 [Hypoxylon fuscum]
MNHRDNSPTASADRSPPPPYGQVQEAPTTDDSVVVTSSRSRKQQARLRSSFLEATCPFPPLWNLYHTLSVGRVLMLGSHEREPIFAVSRHTGWWSGQPDLILHRGPSDTLPPLAAGMGGVGVGRHSIIVLPSLPGSSLDSSQELLVRVNEEKNEWHVRFRFAIEVGPEPNSWRREVFEWRHSHGDVVSAFLDGSSRSGWKLVRLAEHSAGDLVWPRSSDGCEVVAVWSYARLSLTKVLKFRFLGSGATGVLGERWAIMAVMTALRMYQKQQRNRDAGL